MVSVQEKDFCIFLKEIHNDREKFTHVRSAKSRDLYG